jgi:hypothetical protein
VTDVTLTIATLGTMNGAAYWTRGGDAAAEAWALKTGARVLVRTNEPAAVKAATSAVHGIYGGLTSGPVRTFVGNVATPMWKARRYVSRRRAVADRASHQE